jgi:hypothetical protein
VIDKLRKSSQRILDDPLVLWLVVGILIIEGVLLALYVLEVL